MALEIQFVELSHQSSTNALELGENCLHLYFDQLTASRISYTELECGHVAVRSDYRITAVNNFCGWPRETGEDDTCRQCNAQDVEERFDRDERVRCHAN